ncbi:MAG TPA: carboxypeptidase regulatory-like domain-containing protein [Bryobacteraceae bacterium]|nr:carboxypeptidase regulatory-like domain-containing protein [Bryobacteraceae bacterium]
MSRIAPLFLFLVFACAAALVAQDITGSIVGTVLDATGAAVPGVTVTITNTDRNAVLRSTTADSSGNYSVPLLPVGHYAITFEAKGFKKSTVKDIELNVNDKLTVNGKLEVGDVQQEVTVAASAVHVELQSPVNETLIEGRQIRELSLNARNYEQLVALMPGVTYTGTGDQIYVGSSNPLTGQSNAVSFSINGGRTDQNSWTVDGADNVDRGANLTLLNYPSVDSIEEFKVQRSVYSAESGRNAGGMINVVTKSGTNQYHGSAYEFFRNDKLAANNFFNNANKVNLGPDGTARVPPLRYNNFGWTFGGPVWIPRLYKGTNKTFFFMSEEFRRVITYTSVQGTAPTADEKNGIFSAPVCTSFTGSTCNTSSTTITNIDPVAQAYIKDIFSKVPDAPASHVINLALRNIVNFRQESIKIDHVFNERWTLQGRYIHDSIPTIEPRGLFQASALPGVATTSTNSPGHGINVRLTGAIRATLINELGYSYSFGAIVSDPVGLDASVNSPDIRLKLPFAVTLGRIPSMSFGGVSAVGGFGPYRDYNRNHAWFDTLTKIAGRHTLKFGMTANHYQKFENAAGNNVGSFTFSTTPRPTGSAASATMQGWANFLLGNVSTFSQVARDITPDIRANQAEFFVDDAFRARSNFTINLGVRWSLFRQATDANGFLNTFEPSLYNPAKAPQVDANGNLVAGTGDPLNGFIVGGKNSPFGDKIGPERYKNFAPRIGFAWDPFGKGKTSIRGGYGIAYDVPAIGRYEDPITSNPASVQSITITNTTFANVVGGTVSVPTSPPALTAIGTNYQTPYTQQFSLDVQHELPSKILLIVGYAGSAGRHLWGMPDINELQPGQAVALGITPAGTPLTTTTDPRVNRYRPYVGYRAIDIYETWFNSSYNALQVSVQRRFSRGFITGSYTFSKSLTNAGTNAASPQNTYDRSLDKGHAPYDRNHVASASWSYELPFFMHSTGLLKQTLGGWQTSGILAIASGLWSSNPSDSSLGTDPAGLGILAAGSGATPRADFVCDPNANAPHTLQQWFNKSCLQDVPKGVIRQGNASRNGVRGPGYQRWDLSLFKNFHVTERANLQFRFETFNTFNHTNWATIASTLGGAGYGTVTGARDPRVAQLAMRASF